MRRSKTFRSAWGDAGHKYGAKKYHSNILAHAFKMGLLQHAPPDKFDSIGEGKYAEHLFARQQNGEIEDLRFQVRVDLSINGVRIGRRHMRVDFCYLEHNFSGTVQHRVVYDEFKGMATPEFKLKRDLWRAGAGPSVLRVTKANKSRAVPYTHEDNWPANLEDERPK